MSTEKQSRRKGVKWVKRGKDRGGRTFELSEEVEGKSGLVKLRIKVFDIVN